MNRCLTALHIGNFKAFADTQRIPLKPITLIFGPNSAGKSSFIHSLALAHEAQFGREKRSLARLDVHHTDIGGSSIDLGGFRQFVHRAQANRRVEWGAELTVANLSGRLIQLLASVNTITVTLSLGIELDDQDRPKPDAKPRVESIDISVDHAELLYMSRRRSDSDSNILRLDRLDTTHPVFRQVLKALVESATTSEEMRPEDFDGANVAIAEVLPELQVRIEQFFPTAVELPKTEGTELSPVSMLFPISKGNRREDIAQAVRFYLPRTINDLVKGLSDVLADELKHLQYLGPLRSFPPRHLAFAEHEDANWYAGGGYAWDVVRRDDQVRQMVNGWLGSDKLKTPYKLIVRSLFGTDTIEEVIESRLEEIEKSELDLMPGDFQENPAAYPQMGLPYFKDHQKSLEKTMSAFQEKPGRLLSELVLIDKRTNTFVTHRDVGIGISQVLPVLVMAYGSEGKLIAMEQPEIHLHPALQAELGDVFIEAALGERKNTFILETHSEHLILRLMRRMRETYLHKDTGLPPITPADISVLYVEPDGTCSIVREMPLNELGELVKSWPGGFFEEGLREQFGDA
ncbi:MAG: hypothetical protein QG599_1412 [Pseudomonadota bacterium]|nr:hypothetical protein [Pseudomonadota bacterium]